MLIKFCPYTSVGCRCSWFILFKRQPFFNQVYMLQVKFDFRLFLMHIFFHHRGILPLPKGVLDMFKEGKLKHS